MALQVANPLEYQQGNQPVCRVALQAVGHPHARRNHQVNPPVNQVDVQQGSRLHNLVAYRLDNQLDNRRDNPQVGQPTSQLDNQADSPVANPQESQVLSRQTDQAVSLPDVLQVSQHPDLPTPPDSLLHSHQVSPPVSRHRVLRSALKMTISLASSVQVFLDLE